MYLALVRSTSKHWMEHSIGHYVRGFREDSIAKEEHMYDSSEVSSYALKTLALCRVVPELQYQAKLNLKKKELQENSQ